MERSFWSVNDFVRNLGLKNSNLDSSKELCAEYGIKEGDIEAKFVKRDQAGYKVRPFQTLVPMELVYDHPPDYRLFQECLL